MNTLINPRFTKLLLVFHITSSVGWLGAVAVFFALAVTGLRSDNLQLIQAVSISMEVSAIYIILPFSLISLLTGILQFLSTKWGFFKYRWTTFTLLSTVIITALLLIHLKPIRILSSLASGNLLNQSIFPKLQTQMIADSGAALLVLLLITFISIFKPWGKFKVAGNDSSGIYRKGFVRIILAVDRKALLYAALVALILLIILKHLFGNGVISH